MLMKAGRRLLFPGWHLLPRPDASSQLPADMSTNVGDSPHPTRTGRRSHLQGVGEGVPYPILASVSLLLVGNLEAPSLDHMVAWRERLGTPTGRGKWRGLRDPKSWSWRSGVLTMVLDSTPPQAHPIPYGQRPLLFAVKMGDGEETGVCILVGVLLCALLVGVIHLSCSHIRPLSDRVTGTMFSNVGSAWDWTWGLMPPETRPLQLLLLLPLVPCLPIS